MPASRGCVAILREVKNKWERRTPIAPVQVAQLVQQGVQVLVQPSDRRIFKDQEFAEAGAIITEDISAANAIFCVKEFPLKDLIPNKTYVMFSHTIKAQPYNMPFLDACLQKNVRLIDYECIRKPVVEGAGRLVAFGKFAGIAGMIDILRGLGERFLSLGYSTPFMGVSSSYMYPTIDAAKKAVSDVAADIDRYGLPQAMSPLSFVFTGDGNVAQGAREIFEILPRQQISAADLPRAVSQRPRNQVIGCYLDVNDLVAPDTPGTVYSRKDYFERPHNYRPIFHERVAPYTSVLINGMYWDHRYPRLLTVEQMRRLKSSMPLGLIGVADISCDIEGSVEFSVKPTTIEKPFYIYDASTRTAVDDIDASGVLMLGIDNLPAEFPRDASLHFSSCLFPFVESIAKPAIPFEQYPEQIRNAVITDNGKLTPLYTYITQLREANERTKPAIESDKTSNKAEPAFSTSVMLEGHLFDSGFINKTLDLVEYSKAEMQLIQWKLGADRFDKSTAVLQLNSDSPTILRDLVAKMKDLTKLVPTAETTLTELPYASPILHNATNSAVPAPTPNPPSAAGTNVLPAPEKRVLVLGSGFVVAPLVEYLSRDTRNEVVVGSVPVNQAKRVVENANRANVHAIALDAAQQDALAAEIEKSDLVVSFLPVAWHKGVAEMCISKKKNMVTASYVQKGMHELDSAAKDAGVIILNEVGLDPGIDHMSAIQTIEHIQSQGSKVVSFESMCGGLPAPEAADNPLGYKFSWSPRGVLTASQNPARFLQNGKVVEIAGEDLLNNARPFRVNPAFALEHLPNRDSIHYQQKYGLQHAHTVYRGTLRYQGFSAMLDGFAKLGLLDQKTPSTQNVSWSQFMLNILQPGTSQNQNVEDAIRSRLSYLAQSSPSSLSLRQESIDRIVDCAKWLGVTSSQERVVTGKNYATIDSFCELLQKRLQYKPNERDMVFMTHQFGIEHSTGKKETLTSTLVAYGDNNATAMARTVGLPAGISAQLILDGAIPQKGIVIPTVKEVYNPVLQVLHKEGIVFNESITPA